MLTSINPLGERARNQSFAVTATAYVAGSTFAGAVLGGALGAIGALGAPLPVAAPVVIAVVALLGLLFDAGRFGLRVPGPRRQVNEDWLATYRGWVYGAGFGGQLGLAFVTIVAGSITWVAFAAALLSGSATAGLVIGATFGFARALPVLSMARTREPAALRSRMARLDRARPRVTGIVAALQVSLALGLLAVVVL